MPSTGRNQSKDGFGMSDVDTQPKTQQKQSKSQGGFEMEDVYPKKEDDSTGLRLNNKNDGKGSDWEMDTDAGKKIQQ